MACSLPTASLLRRFRDQGERPADTGRPRPPPLPVYVGQFRCETNVRGIASARNGTGLPLTNDKPSLPIRPVMSIRIGHPKLLTLNTLWRSRCAEGLPARRDFEVRSEERRGGKGGESTCRT